MKSASIALLLVVSFLFIWGACSKEVKQPSEDSLLALEALALIDSIKSAYVRKDLDSLRKFTTEEGFDALRKDIKDFESAELSFTPKRVEIDGERLSVNLMWEGKWKAEGLSTAAHGLAVFVFVGKPLMLQAIELSNPFGRP